MKFQTRIETSVCPLRRVPVYARSQTKCLEAVHALSAKVTSILIMETTHVRIVRRDMSKTPPTRTTPPAWTAAPVRDEPTHHYKLHVRIVLPDSLATTVFARHAQASQYQQPGAPHAQAARAAESLKTATRDVSVP